MKGRIKNIFKRIKKYPITIWMIASVLILSTMYFSFAAYNGTADVKRVVSTQSTSNTVFSSNYMEVFSLSNLAVKNLRTTNEGNFICSVTVCNYDQLYPTNPAMGKIDYDFTAELVKYNSNNNEYVNVSEAQMNGSSPETFYVKKTMDENEPFSSDTQHTLNSIGNFTYTYHGESLAGGTSYRDTFDICFDEAEVAKDKPEVFIRVTAIPTAESIQQNSGITTISCILSVSRGRAVETGWHGSILETKDQDYDGYNLILEGSGSGTIDVMWDSEKFSMNPAFVSIFGGNDGIILRDADNVPGRTGWMKITLKVNSMAANRYVIQFYKKKASEIFMGDNFVDKYIECGNYNATGDGE